LDLLVGIRCVELGGVTKGLDRSATSGPCRPVIISLDDFS
jgi:hypothetical protein